MYKKAGIFNIKKFYKDKFAHEASFDVSNMHLCIYNINFSKIFWICRNVKPNSSVLDFGCGSGTLAMLKNKGCRITGIDYSKKASEIAKKVNNYDSVFYGSIFEFNHPPESFDYIVSLDVFGHIPMEEKDATIKELKKFLKPDGIMLHGIECGNINYVEMTEDELKSFIEVDGHVGIEDKNQNINRFKKFFKYMDGDVRFTVENSVDEYLKQIKKYGVPFESGLINYLKSLSPSEKLAFDIANGLVQLNMEKQKIPSLDSSGGFLFLRGSDHPLLEQDFIIEIWQRSEPLSPLHDNRIFCRGWYDIERAGNSFFRWGSSDCQIQLPELKRDLQLKIFSSFPEIKKKHVNVIFTNEKTKEIIQKVELKNNIEQAIILRTKRLDKLDLGIFIDTVWKPALYDPKSDDQRVLGIGINELKFL